MEFFNDYISLKCDNNEFDFLKHYLNKSGWSWYSGFGEENRSVLDYSPPNLFLISVKYKSNNTIIPYYQDESEYIEWDKEAKEVIRNIKLKELGI